MATEAGDKPAAPATPENYEGVGHSLRVVRERHGLSLADVSSRIRIRKPHLEAIEHGRFIELPGPVYVTGFLRSYAEFLGLEPEKVVAAFQAESDVARQRSALVFPMPRPEQRTPRIWLVLLALLIAGGAYFIWYRYQETFRSGADLVKPLPPRLADLVPPPPPPIRAAAPPVIEPPVQAAAPAQAEAVQPAQNLPAQNSPGQNSLMQATVPAPAAAPVVAAAPVPAPAQASAAQAAPAQASSVQASSGASAVPAPVQPSPPAALPAPILAAGQLEIRADTESWIQVRGANNEPLYTRLMAPGESYRVPDRPGLTLATGNAGGLQLSLQGKPLPRIGESGEVKRGLPLDPAELQAALKVQ
ncbi:helix-turn-helix domain-containing protein [Ferrovibrio sp.]|uniref:helix-turn-helix domain-containing protein n=1 Tax=Ferrovibrio sp. TaxID=1917215 RepID=UPI0025BB875A|nr:helix-turn-helix domain-containing protein [Ferrovibrio sp.]MBX3455729.1 helix-turn-helix domain-containing protein [Ferrovibrio sp.]